MTDEQELRTLAHRAEDHFAATAPIDVPAGLADVLRRGGSRRPPAGSSVPRRATLAACFAVVVAGLLWLGLQPGPAGPGAAPSAVDPAVQGRVDRYLAANPGGEQTGPAEISYNRGAVVITVAGPGPSLKASDCPSGWVCFYDSPQFGYARGKVSSCGWQSLDTFDWQHRIESAQFNRDVGAATFFARDPLTGHNEPLFTLSPAAPALPDVGTARNRADAVYVYC